jgi:hypothetical protein
MSPAVNGTPLTPGFGALGGRRWGEVLVLESVRIAFEVEDLGVVHEPVDHGGGRAIA